MAQGRLSRVGIVARLILLLFPMAARTRLLLHDLVLFYNLPQIYNWIFVLFALDSMFFQWNMHRRPTQRPVAMILLRNILYENDDKGFFVNSMALHRGKRVKTYVAIQMKALWFFNRIRYFTLYVGEFYCLM